MYTKFEIRSFTHFWDNRGYLKIWAVPGYAKALFSPKFLMGFLWALSHWAGIQLINFLGTSKYIQTIGKTYRAPQTTLIQKAHYQHKSQFPYCARKDNRDFYYRQPTRLSPGKSPKPLPGRHCETTTTARQERSIPDFSRHQEPARLWRSTATREPF